MDKTSTRNFEYEITPPQGFVRINFPEIWRYRELLYVFAWRDIKVRYKQTLVGIAWAVFQPLMTMIIFSVFFGRLAKVPSDGTPYPIFVYSGLLLWNYFSTALTSASNCLVENESIVKKVYFPRLILPVATAVTPTIDFFFALLVFFGLAIFYKFPPSALGLVMLPVLLLVSLVAASGLGLALAALNAKYRDVRYILPFFIQILLFVTPVIYPVGLIPERWRFLMFFNPMAGVISFARNTLLGTGAPDWRGLMISAGASLLFLFVGLMYFRRTERFLADVL